jgi:hypothetical protein
MFTGVKYFSDELGLNPEQFKIAFNFYYNNSYLNIKPEYWATEAATGIVNNNNFFNFDGTGYFNGSTYLQLDKRFILGNDSVILFSFERQRNADEILFSSVLGDSFNTYSGFCVGVNDANKIYFKYWNPVEGVFTFTHPHTLANKNIIYISKKTSTLSIGNFNNNIFEFENSEFNIKNDAFRESDNLIIGGKLVNNNWLDNTILNFSGYIDNFYLIKDCPDVYVNQLVSGLYATPLFDGGNLVTECFNTGFLSGSGYSFTGITGYQLQEVITFSTGITGYSTILTGSCFSGITGYQDISLGFYVDNCGITKEIFEKIGISGQICNQFEIQIPVTGLITNTQYNQIALSGIISGTENVFVTGIQCFEYTSGSNFIGLQINTGFLESLSFSEISLLSEVKSSDKSEFIAEKYRPNMLYYNNNLNYDSINNTYYEFNSNINSGILLFKNGQLLINSGYSIVTSGYENLIIPNLDFSITDNLNIVVKNFNQNDFIFYDNISGNLWAYTLTGNSITLPPIDFNKKYFIFKNGQKLIENIDYIVSSNTVNFLDISTNEINYILFKEYNNNFYYLSGSSGTLKITGKFNHACSQIYLNGIKQKYNNNYIENSDYDMISGTFYEKTDYDIIYNNTNDFFV